MPTNYSGMPANAVAGLVAASTLLKTTVATPATMVTTTPHNMVTGDVCHIKKRNVERKRERHLACYGDRLGYLLNSYDRQRFG
jgi:hypothetical protein